MVTRGHGEMQRDTGAAAGRREVGARFIVHSYEEGAAKPRPYLRPPCGGQARSARSADPTRGRRSTKGRRPYLKTAEVCAEGALSEVQLEFQADDAGVGVDVAQAEVSILTVLNLGDAALTAAKLGRHLRLGQAGSHPRDDELINEPCPGREPADGLRHPAIAVSAQHLVHIAIGAPRRGPAAGECLNRGHGQALKDRAMGERRARSAAWSDLAPMPRRWTVRLASWA